MPRNGFKSITVNEKFYDKFFAFYKKNKKYGSFASFTSKRFLDDLDEKEKLQCFAKKITIIPEQLRTYTSNNLEGFN